MSAQGELFGEAPDVKAAKVYALGGPAAEQLARRTDPETSAAAAARVDARAMRGRLLRVFASGDFTAEEAARAAGYTAADGGWKRVSDLKNAGLIWPTGATRTASSGRQQDVLAITDEGRVAL